MQIEQIESLLPEVFRRTLRAGSPLRAITGAMSDLLAPSEAVLARLSEYVDPATTPTEFLPMLAAWVNLDGLFDPPPVGERYSPWAARPLPMPAYRLRKLIAAAAELARWRGSPFGLQAFLEIATGFDGYVLEDVDGAVSQAFHLSITAPGEARSQQDLIECIVRLEIPAYVTWDLKFADSTTLPTTNGEPA